MDGAGGETANGSSLILTLASQGGGIMPAKPVLVFDVNETLLDLDYLAPFFAGWFGRGEVMREWFAQLILYSQTLTITGVNSDFKTLAGAVLRMLGTIKGGFASCHNLDHVGRTTI
jgi:hypothetical protein